ncbi:ornithine carbamoyltransferase [candidate division KSB1 bacterium]|nr:ornithine carbamoyltransferase [candidate division KSB1 bacterium]
MKKDFLAIPDFTGSEIDDTFRLARQLKEKTKKAECPKPLAGKTIALIFHKPSLRTRVSFEVGVAQLGGTALYITDKEIQLGVRESIHDAAKVLSRYVDGIMIRTFAQSALEELARFADVPVINGLTDLLHPCQVMGDMLTIVEKKGKIEGMKVAYLGDGNNVANSWLNAASRLPFDLRIATSPDTPPDGEVLARARKAGISQITITDDPLKAISGADVVYTDVWASMGQKHLAEARAELLRKFQVNEGLLRHAHPDCIVMHCLPADRGQEITALVMDGPHSVVFDQAENRLHIQKAILIKLIH